MINPISYPYLRKYTSTDRITPADSLLEKVAVGGIFHQNATTVAKRGLGSRFWDRLRWGKGITDVSNRATQGLEAQTLAANKITASGRPRYDTSAVLSGQARENLAKTHMASRQQARELPLQDVLQKLTPEDQARVAALAGSPRRREVAARKAFQKNLRKDESLTASINRLNNPPPSAGGASVDTIPTPGTNVLPSWATNPWVIGGGGAAAAGGAFALGHHQAEAEAKRKRNMAFGSGLAVGLGAPTIVRGLGNYVQQLQNPYQEYGY